MSEYNNLYKRPYKYKSKIVSEGLDIKVKALKKQGRSFAEIGKIIGRSRQQVSQIYYKTIAKGY